jgi:phosphatidate cytidylyltransferase
MTAPHDVAPADVTKSGDLVPRLASAVVMASVGVGAAWVGGWAWAAAAAIVMALAAREWCKMVGADGWALWSAMGLAALAGIVFVKGQGLQPAIAAVIALIAMLRATHAQGLWAWAGSVYLVACLWAFAGLRFDDAEHGRMLIFGLFIVVWATDSAAYLVGRAFGGPRLMPVASPNKTWSGFVGGSLAGTLAGFGYALFTGAMGQSAAHWAVMGLLLSLATQGGDILESLAKRKFGVKDSSDLIPGHGGLLDRLDGHFSAALLLAAAILVIPGLYEALA